MKAELIEELKKVLSNTVNTNVKRIFNEAIKALEKQESEQVSAEEVLSKFVGMYVDDDVDKVYLKSDVIQAMKTYASNKESDAVWVEPSRDAVEFAEWLLIIDWENKIQSTQELYNQFLKEKEGKI